MVAYVIYYIYNSTPCLCVSFLSIKDYIGSQDGSVGKGTCHQHQA